MAHDKDDPLANEYQAESGSRARNRTVMLTPDITSQVRNRLVQDGIADSGAVQRQLPPGEDDSGFYSPQGVARSGSALLGLPPLQSGNAPQQQRVPSQSVRMPEPPSAHPQAPVKVSDGIYWSKTGPLVGFLVSFDRGQEGEFFPLRVGRLIVTTAMSSGESCLVINDESVSPTHAIIRVGAAGEVQVLDQLSENGTRIRKTDSGEEISLSGEKSSLEHGDVVSFGSRNFAVCLVPRGSDS